MNRSCLIMPVSVPSSALCDLILTIHLYLSSQSIESYFLVWPLMCGYLRGYRLPVQPTESKTPHSPKSFNSA